MRQLLLENVFILKIFTKYITPMKLFNPGYSNKIFIMHYSKCTGLGIEFVSTFLMKINENNNNNNDKENLRYFSFLHIKDLYENIKKILYISS